MAEVDRIRWRCRRGLLELDLILKSFLERRYGELDTDEQRLFVELLDEADNDLLDWALGRREPTDPRRRAAVQLLRSG
jgi:antitoxin CptB